MPVSGCSSVRRTDKNIGQLFFFVGIHDVGSGQAGTLVHTHIQCPVEAEGESPFAVIKVMGRYAEVGKYGIHFSMP